MVYWAHTSYAIINDPSSVVTYDEMDRIEVLHGWVYYIDAWLSSEYITLTEGRLDRMDIQIENLPF